MKILISRMIVTASLPKHIFRGESDQQDQTRKGCGWVPRLQMSARWLLNCLLTVVRPLWDYTNLAGSGAMNRKLPEKHCVCYRKGSHIVGSPMKLFWWKKWLSRKCHGKLWKTHTRTKNLEGNSSGQLIFFDCCPWAKPEFVGLRYGETWSCPNRM